MHQAPASKTRSPKIWGPQVRILSGAPYKSMCYRKSFSSELTHGTLVAQYTTTNLLGAFNATVAPPGDSQSPPGVPQADLEISDTWGYRLLS